MGVAFHAYLMGHLHRLKHLAGALCRIKAASDDRVRFMTAGAINDRIRGLSAYSLSNIAFSTMPCTPQLPSTTWVTPKSVATDIKEIASSSVSP